MNLATGPWGPVVVILATYLLGSFLHKRHVDQCRDSLNKRFDELDDVLKSRKFALK